ncbi:MAG: hypothetical protein RJA34_158 [Pseudomonadota bacterium]|jgi:predicted N-acyltransferase
MLEQPFGVLNDYVIRVFDTLVAPGLTEAHWDTLVNESSDPSPFIRYAYLDALHQSGSATADTGWTPRYITLWRQSDTSPEQQVLVGACPLYIKSHSYGEYVFDWSWAQAYERHGLDYYPKALVAVPFTPVPGTRLLARDAQARAALLQSVMTWCQQQKLSSLHLLFLRPEDETEALTRGLLLRHSVQFHWHNRISHGSASATQAGGRPESDAKVRKFQDFTDFLNVLTQEKRKKIRQERRKVQEAGVAIRAVCGADISEADWNFFYECYTRTYLEHGNAPYLRQDFFERMAQTMANHWVLFVAERNGQPIACSLIGISEATTETLLPANADATRVAYGRYWGALDRVDCLHFELCYYAPIEWCIAHRFDRFEGGAQGEHKMARALMPVKTTSAHWLAIPAFSEAVERFLDQEKAGISDYLEELDQRSPIKAG